MFIAFALLAASCGDGGEPDAAPDDPDPSEEPTTPQDEDTEADPAENEDEPAEEDPSEGEEPDEDPVDVPTESRFTGVDTFCTPAADGADNAPEDVGPGMTSEEVVITNVRLQTEDLVAIGFAFDNGDPTDQAETFVRVINEQCGGIHGRTLTLYTVDLPVPGLGGDADLEAQERCTTIAEDQGAVAAFSFTGVGVPIGSCLTAQNDVIFVTTYDASDSDFEQAQGRFFSFNHKPTDILTFAVRELADQLEGKTIGVVHGDESPDPQVIQQGLLAALDAEGIDVARVDVLDCGDGPVCAGGIIESVQGMRADGVDVIFPLLNTLTLPGYLGEMVLQEFSPGDVQFYNTSYLAMDSELVAGKAVEFGGEDVGLLYNGAILVSASRAGEHRLDDFEPDPFVAMCNRVYAENSDVVSEPYDFLDDVENLIASSVASHCAGVRVLARAIEAAGPNPSRTELAEALASLGDIDSGEGIPSSFTPGKPSAPDVIVRNTFHFPCPVPVTNSVGHCILPDTDFLPIPGG